MLRHLNAKNFLMLYLLASMACDRRESGNDAGPPLDAGAGSAGEKCEGEYTGPTGGGGGSQTRRERVQCYVADAVDGKAECLPFSDRTVVKRVQEAISSCGFATEYVLGFEDERPLPSACEPLVECCAGLEHAWEKGSCFNAVTVPEITGEMCTLQLTEGNASRYACTDDAGTGLEPGADAGESDSGTPGDSGSHSLCCYRTCGHPVCY